MSSTSWADEVEEDTQEIEAVEKPVASKPQMPKLEVLKNLTQLNFIFDRRMDTVVFVDLDGLKKGVGKGTYNFINGSLDHNTAVLLFRRAAHHEEHEHAELTKAQKRRSKHDKGAASSIRVACATCRNTLTLRPHLGSTRFLIESPHDQTTGTRLLMSFYISHVVSRFKQLSRTSTAIYVVTPEQGAAEAIDLAKKLSPEQKIEQVAVETLESFQSANRPALIVMPTREKFLDQLPGDSGLDTARKRVLKFFTESRNLPTTKGALEAALQPFCRLRGDVDSWSVVDLLKTRKVWAQCDDVCGTFYYPKKQDAKDESKPKKAAPGLNKHADKVDPYLKSGQKVVTAALAVLPPRDQWEQIQKVREAHDKAFQRWPPHINLMFPFVPEDEFAAIAPKMEAALQDFGPIRITLASFSYFSHSKTSKTLFCDPDDESKAVLKRLYTRLETAFPFCVNANHDGFTPHLTLGQFSSDAAVKAMIEQLSKDWQPVQWTLAHVSCLARTGDTPFEERRTYEFKGTAGQVPGAVQDENSPEEQVYRRVVSELQGLQPAQRPRSIPELNAFVRKLVPGTEVPLADVMTLLFERDVITLKKDLNIEERLTPVVINKAALPRLERPASEKIVTDPAGPAAAKGDAAPAASKAFIAAAVYGGSKPGYAFRMGDSGLGYYLEKKA